MKRTLIAIPCMDMVPSAFMKGFLDMRKPAAGAAFSMIQNTVIYAARNLILDNAVEAGFDRVFWLDSDVIPPVNVLEKMCAFLDEYNADYVSGVYYLRKLPTEPVIYKSLKWEVKDGEASASREPYIDYPQNGVFRIAGSGFGCVMTSGRLLRILKEEYGAPFTPLIGMSEDLSFCYRVNQVGGVMYCDSSIQCGHIGQAVYDKSVYEAQNEK